MRLRHPKTQRPLTWLAGILNVAEGPALMAASGGEHRRACNAVPAVSQLRTTPAAGRLASRKQSLGG
jgi:hypothetical protein